MRLRRIKWGARYYSKTEVSRVVALLRFVMDIDFESDPDSFQFTYSINLALCIDSLAFQEAVSICIYAYAQTPSAPRLHRMYLLCASLPPPLPRPDRQDRNHYYLLTPLNDGVGFRS